jgi:hypothetical protein
MVAARTPTAWIRAKKTKTHINLFMFSPSFGKPILWVDRMLNPSAMQQSIYRASEGKTPELAVGPS